WLVSTPKHLALFRALGWDPPQYAHLPLLLNSDESKLSKRSGHADVKELLRRGYLPEAVINFAALLGWNPKTTDELFSLPELIEKFSVQGLNRGNPVVNTDKLQWFNKNYIRDRIQQGRLVGDLVDSVRDLVAKEFGLSTDVENDLDGRISRAFQMAKDRLVFPSDVTKEAKFMFRDPDLNSEEARSLVGALPKSQMLR
ncbi:Glutamate--tRNA ligase mitochondrial, partial [Spiromyces aspiralis]